MTYYIAYTANRAEIISLATLIKRTFFLIVFIEFYKSRKICGDIWTYINGYYLALVIMFLLQSYPILAGRGTAVLYFMQIFVFCDMVYRARTVLGKCIILLLIAALNLSTMNGVIKSEEGDYIPYQNELF